MEKNLYLLKKRLQKEKLDGFIIPSEDEFLSEYTGPHYRRLEWATGFTGSNGAAVIHSHNKAAFFTDGRYSLQATIEVPQEVYEIYDFSNKTISDWIKENFIEGDTIGYNSWLFTEDKLDTLEEELEGKYKLVNCENYFIDELWENRPTKSIEPAFIYNEKYCGISYLEKLKQVRDKMNPHSEVLLLTTPESICWLFNLRAKDQEHTPILHSYAIICRNKVKVFTDFNKITDEIFKARPEIEFHAFSELKDILHNFNGKTIQIDPLYGQKWFFEQLEYSYIIREDDPCINLKVVKNPTEIQSMKKAHILDGIALVKILYWLEQNVGKTELDEITISDKLLEFRQENQEFFSLSFATISGYGPSSSIIHYKAKNESKSKIGQNNFLLLDSGAQYYSGTTDVTRTIPIGNITEEQKKNYTLVLKSHIMLGSVKFPQATTGTQLDSFARYHLWQHQKDFKHGSGHGVGCFLGVHEGPARISKAFNYHQLQAGMIFSNEPGFYLNNEYGIRIENLVVVKKYSDNFLEFENLTMVPINKQALQLSLMTKQEVEWLNDYHKQVWNNLSSHIEDENIKHWLKEACKEISL